MPDGQYKRVFNIPANTSNIQPHDAVILSVGAAGGDVNLSATTPGASASAFVTFYNNTTPLGAGGYPLPATAAATGGLSMNIVAGDMATHDGNRFTILPVQIFSVGGVTGGQLFGLK